MVSKSTPDTSAPTVSDSLLTLIVLPPVVVIVLLSPLTAAPASTD
jgi:hypothetical protein